MRRSRQLFLLALVCFSVTLLPVVTAADDDAADDYFGDDATGDDATVADDATGDDNTGDDATAADDATGDDNTGDDYVAAGDDYQYGDDYIKYWTNYAILPKRCIVHNDVDVIVFSVFNNGYKQCSNDAVGTYITPVPTFVNGYMDQLEWNAEESGVDDYATPDSATYTQCTRVKIQNSVYYVQLGCTDGTSQSISVNIYSDENCQYRDAVDGYDDANIDTSQVQLPFKQCKPCVNYVDVSDDQVDDMFYENIQMNAPLCSAAWESKESCDRRCQRTGVEKTEREGWNTADKILLTILAFFGAGMLVAIVQKRTKMSNKDALLEQAAMSAAGLQQAHVIGIFILVVLVIAVFALLGLKNITWALLLIMNTVLFGYLMKLTVDSGVSTGKTVIGPDGTIIRHADDSDDDSSVESATNENAGTYRLPNLA